MEITIFNRRFQSSRVLIVVEFETKPWQATLFRCASWKSLGMFRYVADTHACTRSTVHKASLNVQFIIISEGGGVRDAERVRPEELIYKTPRITRGPSSGRHYREARSKSPTGWSPLSGIACTRESPITFLCASPFGSTSHGLLKQRAACGRFIDYVACSCGLSILTSGKKWERRTGVICG